MIPYDDFKFIDSEIWILSPFSGEYEPFSEAAWISDVYIDTLENKRKIRIQLSLPDGTNPFVVMDRGELVTGLLEKLTNVGFSMANERDMVTTLQDILMKTEVNANVHYVHDCLGFHKCIDGKIRYLGVESLQKMDGHKSRYIRWDALKPKGTFNQWRDALKPYVDANPALQFALLVGVSSPVNAKLQRHGVLHETSIYTFVGTSSSGKTTVARLCASIWGNSNKLIRSMNNTENHIYDVISKSCGFITILDDLSAFPKVDVTSQIYSISSSEEKGRCDATGAAKEKREFMGAVIYTSERSVLSQTNKQRGLYSRIAECNNIKWFASAEEAEAVDAIISTNYGYAWKSFMKGLISGKFSQLHGEYNTAVNTLNTLLQPVDGVEKRQIKKFAVLMAAIPYVSTAWGFQMNVQAILNMIQGIFEDNKLLQPPGEVLYDKLINEIIGDKASYPSKNGRYPHTGAAHGEDSDYNGKPCFWIIKEHFQKLLTNFGYPDIQLACKILYEAGFLVKFPGGRYYYKHKVSGEDTQCYAMLKDLSSSTTQSADDQKKAKPKRISETSLLK